MPTKLAGSMKMEFEDRALRKLLRGEGTKIVRQAFGSALNRALAKELTKMYQRVGAETTLAQNLIRKRTKVFKANRRKPYAIVHAITWPINAGSIVGVQQKGFTKRAKGKQKRRKGGFKGVTAGKYKFPGAFLAPYHKTGTLRAYKRVGKDRKPVKLVGVDIHEAMKAGVKSLSKSAIRKTLKVYLPKEIKWRVSKHGRKHTRRGR